MAGCEGVRYLRTSRGEMPVLYGPNEEFPVGGSKVLRVSPEDRLTVVAAGATVHEALKAADALAADGISVQVIDLYSVKPVDRRTLREAAEHTGCLLTVEDHHEEGGIGDAVLDAFLDGRPTPRLVRLAVRTMPGSATPEEQLHAAGIDAESIAASAKLLVETRDRAVTRGAAYARDDDVGRRLPGGVTMAGTRTVRAGRRTVEVHRPDKVLFPGDGPAKEYTKADLVAYYREVAPFMLPHLRGRPLMLERYPDGLGGPRFMQKNVQDHDPDWIRRVEVPKEGGTVVHPVCDDTATLVYLADQASSDPAPVAVPGLAGRPGQPSRPAGLRPRPLRRRLRAGARGRPAARRTSRRTPAAVRPDDHRLPRTARRRTARRTPGLRRGTGVRQGTSPTPSPRRTPSGSPRPPERRTAATASTWTSSATPTPRPRSPPSPSAPSPAPRSPHP